MIEWTQKNIYKIYDLYDKYSDVLNQRYGYRAPDNKYSFLLDCQKEVENQRRPSIDGYIDELSARLGDADELRRIKEECTKPHLEFYKEECNYYKPVDKYVEMAKARVLDILGDID